MSHGVRASLELLTESLSYGQVDEPCFMSVQGRSFFLPFDHTCKSYPRHTFLCRRYDLHQCFWNFLKYLRSKKWAPLGAHKARTIDLTIKKTFHQKFERSSNSETHFEQGSNLVERSSLLMPRTSEAMWESIKIWQPKRLGAAVCDQIGEKNERLWALIKQGPSTWPYERLSVKSSSEARTPWLISS